MTELGINPKLPSWDGDWRTFDDYKLACYLEFDGLKEEDQVTLAPKLTRNLVGKAWEACTEIDREKLRRKAWSTCSAIGRHSRGGLREVPSVTGPFVKV